MADAGSLLAAVADALNACEAAGLKPKLRHGIVFSRAGYVLPVSDHQWGARTLRYTEFSDGGEEED